MYETLGIISKAIGILAVSQGETLSLKSVKVFLTNLKRNLCRAKPFSKRFEYKIVS